MGVCAEDAYGREEVAFMLPVVAGAAAVVGGIKLGKKLFGKKKKKKHPAPPPPQDPRVDQLMQDAQQLKCMLGVMLSNQQKIMAGQAQLGMQQQLNNAALFANPAALNTVFGGCQSPAQFSLTLNSVSFAMTRPH
jgi:hypothetical protein